MIDNFIKFGWTVPLKNKNAQTTKDSFEILLMKSKIKPKLIETDRGKEFYNSIFQTFSNKNNIKHYSRNSSLAAVFAEIFNRTIRDLLKRPVFERGESNWIDIFPTVTKHYNNRTPSSIKLTPTQVSLEKIEGFVCQTLLDKRKKRLPKFRV